MLFNVKFMKSELQFCRVWCLLGLTIHLRDVNSCLACILGIFYSLVDSINSSNFIADNSSSVDSKMSLSK